MQWAPRRKAICSRGGEPNGNKTAVSRPNGPMRFAFGLICAAWVCALTASSRCAAQEPFATLSISPAKTKPGAEVPLEVVLFNGSNEPVSFATPSQIEATFIVGERRIPVILQQKQRADGEVIQPGHFSRRPYTLRVPDEAGGLAVVEVEIPLPLRGVVDVEARPAPPVVTAAPPPPPPPAPPPEPPHVAANDTPPPAPAARKRDQHGLLPRSAASRIERTFGDHFSVHEPVYFIAGTKEPEAKFQLSFKYRVVGDSGGDADRTQNSVQFGYTQRSLWSIRASSSPFYDTSYVPELFYEYLTPESPGESGRFTFLGLQTGYAHESNGRAGLSSRSLNTLFLRPAVAFGRLDGWRVILEPRVSGYIFDLSDNPELKRYRGYGEMRAIVGRNDGPELSLTGRVGTAWDYGTYQADLTIPLHFQSSDFASYLLLQYFDGYGESLITYREKSSVLRVGFSFVR